MTYKIKWECPTTGFQTENTITYDDLKKSWMNPNVPENMDNHLGKLDQKQIKHLLMLSLCGQLLTAEDSFTDLPWDSEVDPVYISHTKVEA